MKSFFRGIIVFLATICFLSLPTMLSYNAYADENDTSSMEWLTLESRVTPVGTQLTDTSEPVTVAPPPVITIPSPSQINFRYPLLVRPRITTFFSAHHPGVDFAVPYGSEVDAAENGVVTEAGWSRLGYGNTIVVHHSDTTYTRYAHLSSIDVGMGQYVFKGSRIGLVGCTGRCTGPHLHFEIRVGDHFIDPLSVVQL